MEFDLTENEEQEKIPTNESEDEEEEVEEEEVTREEEEDGEDDDHSKPQNKITKIINKQKKKINKQKEKVKNYFLIKLQVLIFVCLAILVLSWGQVENLMNWLAGQEEVTITSKTTDNGCYEIVVSDGNKYCTDLESYEMASEGYNYMLVEFETYYKLRMVR